ncbi:hypothetical protein MBLNU230_g7890t1 [Neophaeotheca triangularis]
MPADRLLGTLLRSLQTLADQEDTPRILGTAASLLTTLNNPLNVTLLASQLLSAPAIWARPEGLRTCLRCLSVFHSAAQALIRHEQAAEEKSADYEFQQLQLERTLPKNDWVTAIIKGADEQSPRWRHLLLLGGLLLGFGGADQENLPRGLRSTLEGAFTTAANLALQETSPDDGLGQQAIALAMNHVFPHLPDHERAQIGVESLLPVLMRAAFHSREGLRSGYWLGAIDLDVQPNKEGRFQWTERAPSYQNVTSISSSPLVSALGPLSRLIGHCVERSGDTGLVTSVVDDLEDFSRTLHLQWRHNKLSEVDAAEEAVFLTEETVRTTTPELWRLLRTTLYGVVIVLRSVVSRTLNDSTLAFSDVSSGLVAQILRTLRSLYFVSARLGSSTFSQYTYVYLTALDVLAQYPAEAESFLLSVRPAEPNSIPQHPLDRCLDLFFLNTAEHFTLVLPAHTSEQLLVPAASPYLAAGANNHLLPIFEAAHSVMLAVFAAPQNAEVTARHLPPYTEALFRVFPDNLSGRQFRMAFKTLVRMTTPPATLAQTQPMLPSILLEIVQDRAIHASTSPLPPQPAASAPEAALESPVHLSEQATLVLTIIDTLALLPLDILEEWLSTAAETVNRIEDSAMRENCKDHFWQTMIAGDMDPDRSQVCHAWWATEGGREKLLFGREDGDAQLLQMSGALPDNTGMSKL